MSVLRPAYQNKAAIYDLLFKAAAETVLTIAVIGCCTDFCWRQLDGDIENSPQDAPA